MATYALGDHLVLSLEGHEYPTANFTASFSRCLFLSGFLLLVSVVFVRSVSAAFSSGFSGNAVGGVNRINLDPGPTFLPEGLDLTPGSASSISTWLPMTRRFPLSIQ